MENTNYLDTTALRQVEDDVVRKSFYGIVSDFLKLRISQRKGGAQASDCGKLLKRSLGSKKETNCC